MRPGSEGDPDPTGGSFEFTFLPNRFSIVCTRVCTPEDRIFGYLARSPLPTGFSSFLIPECYPSGWKRVYNRFINRRWKSSSNLETTSRSTVELEAVPGKLRERRKRFVESYCIRLEGTTQALDNCKHTRGFSLRPLLSQDLPLFDYTLFKYAPFLLYLRFHALFA